MPVENDFAISKCARTNFISNFINCVRRTVDRIRVPDATINSCVRVCILTFVRKFKRDKRSCACFGVQIETPGLQTMLIVD